MGESLRAKFEDYKNDCLTTPYPGSNSGHDALKVECGGVDNTLSTVARLGVRPIFDTVRTSTVDSFESDCKSQGGTIKTNQNGTGFGSTFTIFCSTEHLSYNFSSDNSNLSNEANRDSNSASATFRVGQKVVYTALAGTFNAQVLMVYNSTDYLIEIDGMWRTTVSADSLKAR